MMADRKIDLVNLTLADALSIVGETFSRANEGQPDILLRLVEAAPVRRDPTAAESPTGRPFSLILRGPSDPQLTQGMHDLGHPRHPLPGLFLVPVGQDDEGVSYEAVFT